MTLWDEGTEQRITELNPCIQDRAFALIATADIQFGLKLRINGESGFRTWKQQEDIFNRGNSKRRGGESMHNWGLAFDAYIITPGSKDLTVNDDIYRELANLTGLEWGGDWPDPDRPHFQMPLNNDKQWTRGMMEKHGEVDFRTAQGLSVPCPYAPIGGGR